MATPKKLNPKKPGRKPKDKSWRLRFCAALRDMPNIGRACAAAGVTYAQAYAERERFAAFRAQWATALKIGTEKLAEHCWEVAMRKQTTKVRKVETDEQGRAVITEVVQEPSPTLAIFLLKAHDPEKYRETFRAQISTPPGEAIKVETDVKKLPTEELEMIVAEAVSRGMVAPLIPAAKAAAMEAAEEGDAS